MELGQRIHGGLRGHAMQHNPIDQIPGLITHAGFGVTGEGAANPLLRYIQATPRG